jgi:hypothetical protein
VFSVWDKDYSEWYDNQGWNQIPEGSSSVGLVNGMAVVDIHGQLFLEIRNRGAGAVTMQLLQLTMLVQTTDGRTLELGKMPSEP